MNQQKKKVELTFLGHLFCSGRMPPPRELKLHKGHYGAKTPVCVKNNCKENSCHYVLMAFRKNRNVPFEQVPR